MSSCLQRHLRVFANFCTPFIYFDLSYQTLQGAVHAGIPAIIFGIAATLAGLCSLMLPETLNRKMPDSVAEVERSAKKDIVSTES